MGGPDDMARAVVDRAAARAKAGAVENAFAEEQRVSKEAIGRDKFIIGDWKRWFEKQQKWLIMCYPWCIVSQTFPKGSSRRKSIECTNHCVIRVEDFEFAAAKIPAVF
jgi:hypothetical protein